MRKFNLLVLFVLVAGLAAYAYAEGIPEKVTIDDCMAKKTAVEFPHKAHFEKTKCETCHHDSKGLTAENYTEMEVKSCGTCHVEPENAETPICSSSSKKTNPFHILCISCHKDAVTENAESKAPTKCTACHPKPTE